MQIIVAPPGALSEGSQPWSCRGLLDVTGLRLQVLSLLDRALSTEDDVICRLQGQALFRKKTLLDMDVAEAVHSSVPQHNMEGQHGGIVPPGVWVRWFEVTVHGQLP